MGMGTRREGLGTPLASLTRLFQTRIFPSLVPAGKGPRWRRVAGALRNLSSAVNSLQNPVRYGIHTYAKPTNAALPNSSITSRARALTLRPVTHRCANSQLPFWHVSRPGHRSKTRGEYTRFFGTALGHTRKPRALLGRAEGRGGFGPFTVAQVEPAEKGSRGRHAGPWPGPAVHTYLTQRGWVWPHQLYVSVPVETTDNFKFL